MASRNVLIGLFLSLAIVVLTSVAARVYMAEVHDGPADMRRSEAVAMR